VHPLRFSTYRIRSSVNKEFLPIQSGYFLFTWSSWLEPAVPCQIEEVCAATLDLFLTLWVSYSPFKYNISCRFFYGCLLSSWENSLLPQIFSLSQMDLVKCTFPIFQDDLCLLSFPVLIGEAH
jgi:hypothetical protein